jgi:acetylornithine deacetylase/succinyl-diaminopimelate desuccinylase-like protein
LPATDPPYQESESTEKPVDDSYDNSSYPPSLQTTHGTYAIEFIGIINDNFYQRTPFSDRERKTALWIAGRLAAMGYDATDIEVQDFHYTDIEEFLWMPWEDVPTLTYFDIEREYSQNVILTVPGQSESIIIVGAHYDSVLNPGASDNASGTALLLESAYRLLTHDNYHTIVYVFFGAEEIGFLGANFYYESLTMLQRNNIILMINADVLLEGEFLMYGVGYIDNLEISTNDVSDTVSAVSQNVRDSHGIVITTYHETLHLPSDHFVFGIHGHNVMILTGLDLQPAEGFTDIMLGRFEDYIITGRVLHSPEDCIHYINEQWPGKVHTAMWSFSLLLEELILEKYD